MTCTHITLKMLNASQETHRKNDWEQKAITGISDAGLYELPNDAVVF